MGWTYIGYARGVLSSSGTDLDASDPSSLNVAEGDLLVALAGWGGDSTTAAIAATSGAANNFTMGTVQESGGEAGVLGYKIAATANATATFRLTLGTARSWRLVYILQFRPDASETVTLASGPNPATGNGRAPTSGAINPSGDDLVVVGMANSYDGTMSNPLIGGLAADGSQITPVYGAIWYKIFTSSQSSIAASADLTVGYAWIADIIAFSSVGGSSLLKIINE